MVFQDSDPLGELRLPPGFRFYPTDEELMVQYLCKKIAGQTFPLQIIADIDLYKFDPWVLPSKAMFGEKEWYFFSPRDRKYPNGSRPNRVAASGYWKATGTDKVINTDGRKVGIKKSLVFYIGKAPKGTKTNWIMHEYRLSESPQKSGSSKLDDWVLCRIYKKNSSGAKPSCEGDGSSSSSSTQLSDMLETLPEVENALPYQQNQFDWTALAGGVTSLSEVGPPPSQMQLNGSFMPPAHQMNHATGLDEQVESRVVRAHQNSGGYMFNTNSFTQECANSFDPFAIRYPIQDYNSRFLH